MVNTYQEAVSPLVSSNPWKMNHPGKQSNDDSGHSSLGSEQAYKGKKNGKRLTQPMKQDVFY